MAWFFLSFLSAFLTATNEASLKRFIRDLDEYVLAAGAYLSGFILLAPFSYARGFPVISPPFYFGLTGTVVLNYFATLLLLRALKLSQLSLVIPYLSFTPIFMMLTSYLLLGERVSRFGALGIILIVIGSYVLNISSSSKRFLDPIEAFWKNRGSQYELGVAFIFSFSSNFDKVVMRNSNPLFGTAVIYLCLGLLFFITSIMRKARIAVYAANIHKFLLAGGSNAVGTLAANIALTLQIVPYVISVKRLSIVFALLYSGLLFRENQLLARTLGVIIIFSGIIVIAFS